MTPREVESIEKDTTRKIRKSDCVIWGTSKSDNCDHPIMYIRKPLHMDEATFKAWIDAMTFLKVVILLLLISATSQAQSTKDKVDSTYNYADSRWEVDTLCQWKRSIICEQDSIIKWQGAIMWMQAQKLRQYEALPHKKKRKHLPRPIPYTGKTGIFIY